MVMALASADNAACRLAGIKIVASQGMERGYVRNRDQVKGCIRGLTAELVRDRQVDVLNVALGGEVLRVYERRVNVPLHRRVVEANDLYRAEQHCADICEGGRDEIVDLIPVGYAVDRGELLADPVGCSGKVLEAVYQVYAAGYDELAGLRRLFEECGIGGVGFYPRVRAYLEGLDVKRAGRDCAVVDLGAMSIQVALFREGLLEYETRLPLGTHTIDTDIATAFALTVGQARKLKHEYGQALRSACVNRKLQIPDTRMMLDSRDLATVVQSRAEELLEGVVYQLQSWGFDAPEEEIWLTGGGSRLLDVDELLHRLSGHRVGRAVVKNIQTSREEVLRTPEYAVALGLLCCEQDRPREQSGTIFEKLKGWFGR